MPLPFSDGLGPHPVICKVKEQEKKINKKRRQLDNLEEEVRKRKLNSLSSSLFSEVINDRQWKVEKEETKRNYILPKHCKKYIGYKLSNLLGEPGMGRGVTWCGQFL